MIADETPVPAILEIIVNNESYGPSVVFKRGQEIFLRATDLEKLRIRRPSVQPVVFDEQPYLPLSAFEGLTSTIDEQNQTLTVNVPTGLFESVIIDAERVVLRDPTQSSVGAFLNYDTLLQQVRNRTNIAGFIETGVSGGWGLLTNTFAAGNFFDRRDIVRYDTAYTWDDPAKPARLVVGDTVAFGGSAGQSLRFAGLRYGTEFRLQPNLVTFPTPFFNGQAALPSTMQIYVNDVLSYSQAVDQGPFSINRVPVITGAGEMRLVVKDALGVERSYIVPYYVGDSNLRQGLSDFSFNAGFLREDYGTRSFSYGNAFGSATYRYGVSDSFTVEAHAEGDKYTRMGSVTTSWLVPSLGELSLTAAASDGVNGSGTMFGVSAARSTLNWDIFLNYQHASPRFTQVGALHLSDQVRTQAQGVLGFSAGWAGNVSVSYTMLKYATGLKTSISSVNHSVQLGDRAQLTSYALMTRATNTKEAFTFGISLTIPFGTRNSFSTRVARQARGASGIVEYRHTPPSDRGLGYSIATSHGEYDYDTAELFWRNPYNDVRAQLDHRFGTVAGSLEVNGSIGNVAGHSFFARDINDAYGIVEVPGYGDIDVFVENRPVARTDSDGIAVIPTLNSYIDNKISIDPTRLPIGAQFKFSEITVVPRFRAAIVASYPITRTRSGSVTVSRANGEPVAVGSGVTVRETGAMTYAGYRGEVFIEDMRDNMVLDINDNGAACVVRLGTIPPDVVLPQLPPATCQTE